MKNFKYNLSNYFTNKTALKNRWIVSLLALASTLPYLRTLAIDYYFDDIEFFKYNLALNNLESFSQTFFYNFQPTKPLTTYLMGLTHWLGHGAPVLHRILNLCLHSVAVILLFQNLKIFSQRCHKSVHSIVLLAVSLLFALAPIHTETLTIIQFRGELLAAVFTLLATLCIQFYLLNVEKIEHLFFTAAFLVFASLSKEVFLIVGPAYCLTFYWAAPRPKHKNVFRLMLALLVPFTITSILLAGAFGKDFENYYTYQGNIGWGIYSQLEHFVLATRAWEEGILKTLTGQDLTLLRLLDRTQYEVHLDTTLAFSQAFFSTLLIWGMWLKGNWYRLGAGMILFGIAVYLCVPNRNIGSEHYWYLASAGVYLSLSICIYHQIERHLPQQLTLNEFFMLYLLILSTYYAQKTQSRLDQTENAQKLYLHQVSSHPKLPGPWISAANMMLDLNPNFWGISKNYLDVAKKIEPNSRRLSEAEFSLWLKAMDYSEAKRAFKKLITYSSVSHRDLARYHYNFAKLNLAFQLCDQALSSFRIASALDPMRIKYRYEFDSLQNAVSNNRKKMCSPLKKPTLKKPPFYSS